MILKNYQIEYRIFQIFEVNNNQLINSQEKPEKSEKYNLAYKFKEKIKIWAIKSEEETKKYWTIMFPEEY